jgi:hypothetical protein
MTRRKRGYDECLCKYCAPSKSSHRKWVKGLSRQKDRAWDKWNIKEQYDDYRFGIDPD